LPTNQDIANAELHDRTLLLVARELASKARFRDTLQIAPLIVDRAAATELIIRLARAALSLGHSACAETLLELAQLEASKIDRPAQRAQSLLDIAADFSPILSARAFVVMQEAVSAVNEVPVRNAALDQRSAVSAAETEQAVELLHMGLGNALTALARVDFDRALFLSRQLTDKETSLTAQLAVCRGGLPSQ